MRQGYSLYSGYDMRLQGCCAIVQEYNPCMLLVQFDSVQADPLFRPDRKFKPCDSKFINREELPSIMKLCLGWHLFNKDDFENIQWDKEFNDE